MNKGTKILLTRMLIVLGALFSLFLLLILLAVFLPPVSQGSPRRQSSFLSKKSCSNLECLSSVLKKNGYEVTITPYPQMMRLEAKSSVFTPPKFLLRLWTYRDYWQINYLKEDQSFLFGEAYLEKKLIFGSWQKQDGSDLLMVPDFFILTP